MSLFDILFLSVALAMDCFTVSIVSGVITRRALWRVVLRMSVLFGLFQAVMPLFGWLGMIFFRDYIEPFDHWIAFILLAFIGGNMIKEAFGPEEEHNFRPERLRTQLMLAVATSIDALAVGISFVCTGYGSLSELLFPLTVIGVVSFCFGIVGNFLGISFGRVIARKIKPELIGGIILILIGVKVLLEHLLG
ncbi:manganese efflux pump MntP [Xylanibacter muris]|uniref:Putative manganese efflux pump MntP n=1 Tax=Xylanibacter muris TaxID=2736290 RepID=A0ABX2AQK1_9BACT|nr:manganese efflux pump MntP family protein [Xylanibacter muris]NPD92822.1 manganese efflux pump [Xylanibacter muris]